MKKSWLSGVSVVVLGVTGGAHAADLPAHPMYKAPMAQKVWSWTGFYVGANLGGVTPRSAISDGPVQIFPWLFGVTSEANGNDFIGGVQAGYNWQISNAVVGIEGDYSYSGQVRSISGISITGSDTFESRLNSVATIRGRVGWTFDRLLIYGTGGVAFVNIKDQLTDPAMPFTATSSSTLTGWAAGGGAEYAVSGPWSVKVEYLHVGGLPTRTVFDSAGTGYAFAFKDKIDIGRVGINYKF